MEDSGREDLLKQKSAEVADAQNKVSDEKVDFNSSEIGQKEKEEQFKEIEGAEERAREAERLKEKAKRDKQKADEAAAKALKKEEETPLQKKARHKRNWIIAAIVFAVLVVAGLIVFYFVHSYTVSSEKAIEYANEIMAEAKQKYGKGNTSSKQQAKEYFEKEINKARGNYKFYLQLAYIDFLHFGGYGYDEIAKVLEEAEEAADTEEKKNRLLSQKCIILGLYDSDRYATECGGYFEVEEEYDLQ